MSLPKLGVNVDHVATVRQARRTYEPDPVIAAALATLGGAEIITCHLREDRRHLQDRDLYLLRQTVCSKLNMEMGIAPDILAIACRVRPDMVTLVPERREEVTTEGGLNVIAGGKRLADAVGRLRRRGIEISFFVDPDPDQLQAAKDLGGGVVELHTGAYANARTERAAARELKTLSRAAEVADKLGLQLNAGHGLNYVNIRGLLETIHPVELHIGHSIVSRAVLVGMERAVREMCELIARYAR